MIWGGRHSPIKFIINFLNYMGIVLFLVVGKKWIEVIRFFLPGISLNEWEIKCWNLRLFDLHAGFLARFSCGARPRVILLFSEAPLSKRAIVHWVSIIRGGINWFSKGVKHIGLHKHPLIRSEGTVLGDSFWEHHITSITSYLWKIIFLALLI